MGISAWVRTPDARATLLDWGERAIIAILYAFLSQQLLRFYLLTHNPAELLTLASETLVVVLVLIRRPAKTISLQPADWILAFGATCAGLLLRPANVEALGPPQIGWTLQSVGLVAQLVCKIWLFRNFGVAPALRGVTRGGPYRVVRHPMYASYFVGQFGFLWAFPTANNAVILVIWTLAQLLRIQAEEVLLKRDPLYRAYCERVRWRLIPGLY